jgi:alkylation response protein AidB-like acyl-CoA dehydrogenase
MVWGGRVVEFTENEAHTQLRDSVAKLVARWGHQYYAEMARNDGRLEEPWQALADHGYLAVNLPQAYGGGGAGISELAVVCEEVAAQGCPLLLMLVSCAISGELITRFGTDAQRQAWLPRLVAGEKMVFAITEPDAGSNSHRISTTATRHQDVWQLSGTKYYISGVDEAAAILVVARTGTDGETGRAQLSLFIVDADAAGLRRQVIPMEIRSPEKQYTLFFDAVEVGADRVLGVEGEGLRQVFFGLNPERIMGAALSNGLGRYALDRASEYARERSVWDMPIGAHQGVAHPLAEAKIAVELARLMTTKAAWLHDHDQPGAGEASNMAKFAAADAALLALDRAIQTHGGNGLSSEYGLADLWGMVRLMRIAPVSREMILNFVAQHSLGLARSY